MTEWLVKSSSIFMYFITCTLLTFVLNLHISQFTWPYLLFVLHFTHNIDSLGTVNLDCAMKHNKSSDTTWKIKTHVMKTHVRPMHFGTLYNTNWGKYDNSFSLQLHRPLDVFSVEFLNRSRTLSVYMCRRLFENGTAWGQRWPAQDGQFSLCDCRSEHDSLSGQAFWNVHISVKQAQYVKGTTLLIHRSATTFKLPTVILCRSLSAVSCQGRDSTRPPKVFSGIWYKDVRSI